MAVVEFIIGVAFYVIPLYLANSCAMLFGGGTPLDLNRNWRDGRPVFGGGKTIRGAAAGIAAGTLAAAAVAFFLRDAVAPFYGNYLVLGFLLSVGAVAGDVAASFFKRRNAIPQGESVLFLDQLDFIIGGFAAGSIVYVPGFYEIAVIAVITLAAHRLANFLAYLAKIKKVPW